MIDLEEDRKRWKELFVEKKMSHPQFAPMDIRYQLAGDDWYALDEHDVWFWYDAQKDQWLPTTYGPR